MRRYDSRRPLDDALIQRLLEAATLAPSAGNLQSWHFVVVRQAQLRADLARAAGQRFVGLAPVIVVVCADLARIGPYYGLRGRELYCLQDTAAAVENLLLAATALGLGACWVGAFAEGEVSRLLELPRHLRPVALVPVGFPQTVPRMPRRRPLTEVVTILS